MIDEEVRQQFPGAGGYLDTASLGLPPQSAVDAMAAAIADWQAGTATAPSYDRYVSEARESFAQMVGVPVAQVAVGAQVSALVALAATLLEPGSRILCPEGEFTSLLFPLLVRDDLRLAVTTAPLESLADAVDPATAMVAFSLVQSADGRVTDTAAVREAAEAVGALTLADGTQAAGWLPFEADAFDVTVTGGYKWLLSPRGSAFMTVRPQLLERITPLYAGWYAGARPWESIYGLPLRLAPDARRLDLSPGWLAWVGTAASLGLLNRVGIGPIHEHDLRLANTFRESLGLEASDSAMVSLELASDFDESRLRSIRAAFRAGRLRVGFHLYNTEADVERVLAAMADNG